MGVGQSGVEPYLLCATPLPGRRPIVAIPTTLLLVQNQTVRYMPTFLNVIMAAIGVMFTLIGAYIGERVQLGPPPKPVE